jgi:hypothetical protein
MNKATIGSVFAIMLSGCISSQPNLQKTSMAPLTIHEVCGVSKEYEEIAKLTCLDGSRPKIVERGSIGPRTRPVGESEQKQLLDQTMTKRKLGVDEKDFHILDKFLLQCPDKTFFEYFDLYHCEELRTTSGKT